MFRRSGGPEPLRGTLPRSAEIAYAARLLSVSEIAEVAHQGGHAALVALRVTDHLVDLRPLLLTLGDIGLTPLVAAPAHVLGVVHNGAAMGPQLLQGFVERLLIHSDLVPERCLFLGLGPQPGKDPVQHGDLWIVALEKEVVGVAIGVGVHEDGAAGFPVAPGAPISW